MRSARFVSFLIFLFLFNCSLEAQSIDTLSAQQVIEKGSKGDIILGKKVKKEQLKDSPVSLHRKDSACRKDVLQSSKKLRRKQNRNSK